MQSIATSEAQGVLSDVYSDVKGGVKKSYKYAKSFRESTLADAALSHKVFWGSSEHPDICHWKGTEVVMTAYMNHSNKNHQGKTLIVLGDPKSGKSFSCRAVTNGKFVNAPKKAVTFVLPPRSPHDVSYDSLKSWTGYKETKEPNLEPQNLARYISGAIKGTLSTPSKKKEDLGRYISVAIKGTLSTPSKKNATPKFYQWTMDHLCGAGGGTTDLEDTEEASSARTLVEQPSTLTVATTESESTLQGGETTARTEELPGSGSPWMVRLKGLEEDSVFNTPGRPDNRPVLVIQDINSDVPKNSKLWLLLSALVGLSETESFVVFMTTNSRRVAHQLYAINCGSKIVPLPYLIARRCKFEEWTASVSKEDLEDFEDHRDNDIYPNFLWRPFDFTIEEKQELFQLKYPHLPMEDVKNQVEALCAEDDTNLGDISAHLVNFFSDFVRSCEA